jgi:hypothetical protein
MFSKAKKVLDKEERESLGDRMNEAKGQAGGERLEDDEEELAETGAVRGMGSARGSARTGGGSASQPSRLRASNKKSSSSKKRSTKSRAGSKKSSSSRGKRSSKKK